MSAIISSTRFGLLGPGHGPNGAAGPEGVLAQLRQPVPQPRGDGLPDVNEAMQLVHERRREMLAARRESRQGSFITPRALMMREAQARLHLATVTPTPFHERLALHWGNHFALGFNVLTGYLAGDMDRTAIRPHMLGSFRELLRACVTHPAMLAYLSNDRSFGPNSPDGQRMRRGLNENLGRELLELHTLGVDGGYTQQDVGEAARILTGWTVPGNRATDGGALFVATRHEPGARTVLGKHYPEGGEEQLFALLDDLARHPATARHVTRRMVRHFLGDTAPPEVMTTLARVFRDTHGDLRAVTEALVTHPVSWSLPPRKLRPPVELVFSLSRVMGGLPSNPPLERQLRALGQPWLEVPSPAGWPEDDNAWASPDAVKSRLDWVLQLAGRRDTNFDSRRVAAAVFGDMLSAETRRALERAANGGQALALLVMSPEFQRR